MLPASYRDIHCKNVRKSNGILAPRSAQTMAPMSQRLRRLVLATLGGAVAAWPLATRALREAASHRIFGLDHGFCRKSTDRRFCAAAARTRLDRGPHHRNRVSL